MQTCINITEAKHCRHLLSHLPLLSFDCIPGQEVNVLSANCIPGQVLSEPRSNVLSVQCISRQVLTLSSVGLEKKTTKKHTK